MNNFKKLLASAMALSMVASVLPATNVNAAVDSTCDTTESTNLDYYSRLALFLRRNDVDFTSMNSDHMITTDMNVFDYVLDAEVDVEVETEETVTFKLSEDGSYVDDGTNDTNLSYTIVTARINAWRAEGTVTVNGSVLTEDIEESEVIANLAGNAEMTVTYTTTTTGKQNLFDAISEGYARECGTSFDDRTNAGYVYEAAVAIKTMFGSDYDGTGRDSELAGMELDKMDMENANDVAKVENWADNLETFKEKFSTNLTEDQTELVDGKLDEIYSRLGMGAGDETYENELSDFVEGLTEGSAGFGEVRSLETFLEQETITKAEVRAQIKAIESLKEYRYFKDEPSVQAIIDEYEEMITTIDEIIDALNTSKNEAYAEYVSGGSKSVKNLVAKLNEGDEDSTDSSYLINNITISAYETLKAFKEEVVDVVWTMESKEFANQAVDRSYKNVFATYQQLRNVMRDFDADYENGTNLLTFDKVENNWSWDKLVEHMESVKADLALIEEELPKLDAITLNASDRDLLVQLDDAVYNLTDSGNLTSAQARTVRDAERKVDELFEAYRSKFGTIESTTGWVDMGNGNWNYYEADGTAPTKWICTAPNTWYYVQNGNMMRNYWVWRDANSAYYVGDDGVMVYGPTTVNGYELDANGLWHR